MHNSSNGLNPSEQKLREGPEQVEVSERISLQPEWTRTHSVKTPSIKSSQVAINTEINAEALSVQILENMTIVQVASPLAKAQAEAENNKTVLQRLPKPSLQDSPSVVLVDHISLPPQKPGVVERIGSSSQPTRTVEAVSLMPNSIAQFSLKDDSKNLNAAGVAVIQNHDNTILQYSDSVTQNLTDLTILQYSDSAIHNLADRTVYQAMPSLSTDLNQTVHQLKMSQSPQSSTVTIVPKNRAYIQLFNPSIFRDMFRTSGSFTSRFISSIRQFFDSIWRKIDLKQLQSRFHLGRQLELSSSRINRSTDNVMVLEEQPSLEQYQKKLQELDLCRLSFAKELARNGKFRDARAMAQQISETSHFFKDAQMLIQSWK